MPNDQLTTLILFGSPDCHRLEPIKHREFTVNELIFSVRGSSSGTYEVTFIKDGDSLTALCTCPAGQYGNSCKHRIALLDGKSESISSDNADQVSTVTEWLMGSDVEAALSGLRAAEAIKTFPKDELAVLKKKLARAMNS